MATRVHEPAAIAAPRTPRPAAGGPGDGNGGKLGPAQGRLPGVEEYAPVPSKTGIWVLLAAITMTFAAFTSALVVRQGAALDWHPLTLPRVVYFNTLALLASSVTLEIGRRRTKAAFAGGAKTTSPDPARWLYATLVLGIVFVAGQYAAWLKLRSEGFYLATNPNSSFFYLLTSIHALHVLGGLAGLIYVLGRLNRLVPRRSTLDSFSYYWHFIDILWIYLLWLLWLKI